MGKRQYKTSEPRKYSLNFDLDTRILEHDCKMSRSKAYKKIGNFLIKHGYEHVQYSGYHTISPVTKVQAMSPVLKFAVDNPWFVSSLKSIYLTVIDKQYDLLQPINEVVLAKDMTIDNIERDTSRKDFLADINHNDIIFDRNDLKDFKTQLKELQNDVEVKTEKDEEYEY